MTKLKTILWAYVSELVLSTLLFTLLLICFEVSEIVRVFKSMSSDIATYFSSIMLAASFAFIWAFYSKSDTPFFKWLYKKRAFHVYLSAYVVALVVYLSLLILLIVTSKVDYIPLSLLSVWMFIYGVINVYTFMSNVLGQLKLNMEYNRINDE
ncbi:MAG: hypothetical protein V7784_22140 [Oceanospirillaceae bacterium]